ncbi:MAG: O-antigen ligase family protein [Rhodospirillales bacterium]|nr:O-antigen ligase family protein [Rhodospirillales bacterium]
MAHALSIFVSDSRRTTTLNTGIVLLAASVPALVAGPAAIGVASCLALLLLLAAIPPSEWYPGAIHAAKTPDGRRLIAVFLCWLPSFFITPDIPLTAEGWFLTTGAVVLCTTLWAMLRERRSAHKLMRQALLVSALIAVTLALAAFFIADEILSLIRFQGWVPSIPVERLKGFANAAALLVPAALWSGWRCGGVWRMAAAGYVVAAFVLIAAADTHAPIVAILGACIFAGVCAAIRMGRRRAVLSIAIGVLAVCVGVGAILATSPPAKDDGFRGAYLPTWLVDPHRQAIWAFTADAALSAPIFGHGIKAIDEVEGAHNTVPGLSRHAEYLPAHPHNWLLEIFSETGIVGTIPAMVFIAFYLFRLARDFVLHGVPESIAAGSVSAAYWASGLFNFSFWAEWWQVSHMLLIALILSTRSDEDR